MDNSGGIIASLEGRYASALFDLAREAGKVPAVERDLVALGEVVNTSKDFAALIRNPRLGRDAAGVAIGNVAKLLKLAPLTKNFLGVLAGNGRLAQLPAVVRAFVTISAAARGEVTAEVTSAHPLSAAQISALAAKLKKSEGKSVKIKAMVDKTLLGGLVVRINSRQIDSSIKTRLNSLALSMRG